MRSHFHGSLHHPGQPIASLHQQLSSFATLPTSSYHKQSSLTSPDGTISLRSHPSDLSDVTFSGVPVTKTPASQPPPEITCCLCDKMADTQLIPCKHIVLCSEHAKSSKKCPECRVS